MRQWVLALSVSSLMFGQEPEAEKLDLQDAMAEAGSSLIEFSRAVEQHLGKYPDCTERAMLERTLLRAAVENKDERRMLLWGERVLAREPANHELLSSVVKLLLKQKDEFPAERAMSYGRRLEHVVTGLRAQSTPLGSEWTDLLDEWLSQSLALQARSETAQRRPQEAFSLAHRAFEAFPSPTIARVAADSALAVNKPNEALGYLRVAMMIDDTVAGPPANRPDFQRLRQLHREVHGSDTGLGDSLLDAYDRTLKLTAARRQRAELKRPAEQFERAAVELRALPPLPNLPPVAVAAPPTVARSKVRPVPTQVETPRATVRTFIFDEQGNQVSRPTEATLGSAKAAAPDSAEQVEISKIAADPGSRSVVLPSSAIPAWSSEYSSRYTIQGPTSWMPGLGLPYTIRLDKSDDQVPYVDGKSALVPVSDRSVIRFSGAVPFPPTVGNRARDAAPGTNSQLYLTVDSAGILRNWRVDGWLRSGSERMLTLGLPETYLIFYGDPGNPLTFVFLDGKGLFYVGGKGRVETPEGVVRFRF
jgi:hypothetical protein